MAALRVEMRVVWKVVWKVAVSDDSRVVALVGRKVER